MGLDLDHIVDSNKGKDVSYHFLGNKYERIIFLTVFVVKEYREGTEGSIYKIKMRSN